MRWIRFERLLINSFSNIRRKEINMAEVGTVGNEIKSAVIASTPKIYRRFRRLRNASALSAFEEESFIAKVLRMGSRAAEAMEFLVPYLRYLKWLGYALEALAIIGTVYLVTSGAISCYHGGLDPKNAWANPYNFYYGFVPGYVPNFVTGCFAGIGEMILKDFGLAKSKESSILDIMEGYNPIFFEVQTPAKLAEPIGEWKITRAA